MGKWFAATTYTFIGALAALLRGAPAVADEQPSDTQKHSRAQVNEALNGAKLDGIQRYSARAYIGHEKDEVTNLPLNGGQDLIFRDPKTHEYKGEAFIKPNADGTVQIHKITGAGFDHKTEFEAPILKRETEDAETVLEGKRGVGGFDKQWGSSEKPGKKDEGIELSIPAVKWETKATYGEVSESNIVFDKDGRGTETGWVTNLAGASGGVNAGVSGKADGGGSAGVSVGGGAEALKVEYFKNYFLKPDVDEKGEFSRTVLGGSVNAHFTVAEFEAKAGCFEDDGCKGEASAGGLGIGLGVGWKYSPQTKIPVDTEEDAIGAGGVASTPQQLSDAEKAETAQPADYVPDSITPNSEAAPTPEAQTETQADSDDDGISDAEHDAYLAAEKDGSAAALGKFLSDYVGSPYSDEVKEDMDRAEAAPSGTSGPEPEIPVAIY